MIDYPLQETKNDEMTLGIVVEIFAILKIEKYFTNIFE